MASLLQVGEREIVCLDNELTPSSFFSAKHSINSSMAIFVLPSLYVCIFNRLGVDLGDQQCSTADNPLIEMWVCNKTVQEEDKQR